MFTPFAGSTRFGATGPLTWKTWTGLIVLPLLVMGILTWALSAPGTDHGTATAAVVNHDEPATVQGKTIPLGRELAAELTHSQDSAYDWVLTDTDDAEAGLSDGSYAAVVTIPKDFSAKGTSAATAKPLDAERAVLTVDTSNAAGAADPALSADIADSTQRTLDDQVVETYLDNVYVAFNTIHDKLSQAAGGASRLADGTGELASGASELADGADTLAEATAKLEAGSGELADGLGEAESATKRLPELTRELAAGAEKVADGNEKLADTVVPLADKVIKGIDALPSAEAAAADFAELAERCESDGGSAGFCDELDRAADRFTRDAPTIDEGIASVRAHVVDTRDAIRQLAAGARAVADGNATLADNAVPLAAGIASAADGSRELADGAAKTDQGARRLAGGAGDLSEGAAKLDDGAGQLAEQLAAGLDEIPTYTADERANLTAVAADPTTAAVAGTTVGNLSVGLFAVLALWTLAMAVYIVTRPVPEDVLTSRAPTWRVILGSVVPGAFVTAVAAVAVTGIAVPVLGLGPARAVTFGAVALLAAFAFTALNQAAVAIFGRAGRLASVTVLVLTAALGVVSTVPSPLYGLTGFLPTHGAVIALRAAAFGGGGVVTGAVQLAVWLAVGALATIVITDRRRRLNPRRLRTATA